MHKNSCGFFSRCYLLVAWLIALIATLSSLYFSQVAHMPVCHLCWWQRIFMFPLAVQLGIAYFRRDSKIKIYVLPLAIMGLFFALFHYLLQIIPTLSLWTPCQADPCSASCEIIEWQLLGFITMPLLSFFAFFIIIFLLFIHKTASKPR